MHTVFVRFYKVLNFVIPSVALLLIGSFLLSLLEPQREMGVCEVRNASFGRVFHNQQPMASDPHDFTNLTFDLDCDVRPLWHWNTKMLYVFVKASFKAEDGTETSVTVWDRRINSRNEGILHLHRVLSSYKVVTDSPNTMQEPLRDVVFSVEVSETPFGGMMRYYSLGDRGQEAPSL